MAGKASVLTKDSKSPKEETAAASESSIKAFVNLVPSSLKRVEILKHPDSA